MNLVWMAVIAAVITVEKVLPRGEVLAQVIGALLLAVGVLLLAAPELAAALVKAEGGSSARLAKALRDSERSMAADEVHDPPGQILDEESPFLPIITDRAGNLDLDAVDRRRIVPDGEPAVHLTGLGRVAVGGRHGVLEDRTESAEACLA
jgi:hypothetical protein